jgi:hypothetical protein
MRHAISNLDDGVSFLRLAEGAWSLPPVSISRSPSTNLREETRYLLVLVTRKFLSRKLKVWGCADGNRN